MKKIEDHRCQELPSNSDHAKGNQTSWHCPIVLKKAGEYKLQTPFPFMKPWFGTKSFLEGLDYTGWIQIAVQLKNSIFDPMTEKQ